MSRYTSYPDIVVKAEGLGLDMSGTIYLDRIDNPAIPWGFDNVQIAAGHVTSSGFANGVNLMQNYGGTAGGYIPRGLTNSGSAVMHAAFLKYYQRGTPPNGVNPTPTFANIRDYNGANTPANYPSDFAVPSIEEWELLNMLNEAIPIEFEEGYAIPAFDNYWTSNADTADGSRNSYAFRIDGPVTAGGSASIPRSTATKYRMMYYMP